VLDLLHPVAIVAAASAARTNDLFFIFIGFYFFCGFKFTYLHCKEHAMPQRHQIDAIWRLSTAFLMQIAW
jgi:hypothetical protein